MNAQATNPHAELIERCKGGDRKAQFEIYRLYSKAMLNTAFRITNDLPEAEDALQEAFIDALTKIDRYNGSATFGAWLKRIVINKSIDALKRRKARFVSLNGHEQAETPEPAAFSGEVEMTVEKVKAAVGQLPEGYRVVLSLYLFEGYTHEEIAGILEISVSGSKSQYHRAKEKVRKILIEKQYV